VKLQKITRLASLHSALGFQVLFFRIGENDESPESISKNTNKAGGSKGSSGKNVVPSPRSPDRATKGSIQFCTTLPRVPNSPTSPVLEAGPCSPVLVQGMTGPD